MRTFSFWFLVLLGVCIVTPYVFGVPPRTRRDWIAITVILTFLVWLLPGLDMPVR